MRGVWSVFIVLVLFVSACPRLLAERMMGEVVKVSNDSITASFPARVETPTMMIVLSGVGDSVAGVAIAEKCVGEGPCEVIGKISFVAEASALAAGKRVYVNYDQSAPPSAKAGYGAGSRHRGGPVDQDLKFYYFAAGQTVGYGALGFGYDRTIRIMNGVGIELDAGITGVGNVNTSKPDVVNTDQLIKSANGRLKLDFSPGFGFYAGYRYNVGSGSQENWDKLASRLDGKTFSADSAMDAGIVLAQGIEYGLTMRPLNRLTLSGGYIPKYRADYGTFGVLSEPAYTAELRFATKRGAVRLRGLRTDGYWLADMGITIK